MDEPDAASALKVRGESHGNRDRGSEKSWTEIEGIVRMVCRGSLIPARVNHPF